MKWWIFQANHLARVITNNYPYFEFLVKLSKSQMEIWVVIMYSLQGGQNVFQIKF